MVSYLFDARELFLWWFLLMGGKLICAILVANCSNGWLCVACCKNNIQSFMPDCSLMLPVPILLINKWPMYIFRYNYAKRIGFKSLNN